MLMCTLFEVWESVCFIRLYKCLPQYFFLNILYFYDLIMKMVAVVGNVSTCVGKFDFIENKYFLNSMWFYRKLILVK